MHELVIRNGEVVDGSGGHPFVGDVAIDGGRISAVGPDCGRGRREIDADGHWVAPGWVDVHTHYDGQVMWDPLVTPSSWHGVTTVVMGNCGVGFAPVKAEQHDWLIGLMEGVEEIPGFALAEGLPWNWESFPDYLDAVGGSARVLDVAAQMPHGALRVYVMGQRGADREAANPDDIAEMARLTGEAIDAGAVGFTTSRTLIHRTNTGELVPTTTAEAGELIAIGRELGKRGKGTFGLITDFTDFDGEMSWIRQISRETKRPVWFLLSQNDRRPDAWRKALDQCAQAHAAGEPILAQVAARPIGLNLGLQCSLHPFVAKRAYRDIAELPLAERVSRMRDPLVKRAILDEHKDYRAPIMRDVTSSFHKMFKLGDPPNYEPHPDTSFAAQAARSGCRPEEIAYDAMLENEGREMLFFPLFNYSGGDYEAIREMLSSPYTINGLSDGGAHCGVICDASIPTHSMVHWVRDRSRGETLPVEQVVRSQTHETAELYGMTDRGLLSPGMKADVNVMNKQGLRLHAPEMVHDLPGSARRLIQRCDGYTATICDGVVTFENGEHTGKLPGKLVRA